MKLKSLHLEKFSAFYKAKMDFCPGINVLIGANGTGKSHLLKLLYSTLKVSESKFGADGTSQTGFAPLLAQKLVKVFRPDEDGLARLVYRGVGRSSAQIAISSENESIDFKITTFGNIAGEPRPFRNPEKSIFIPSREAFAMFEGFIAAYANRELSFDETYYDLCVALSAQAVRGARLESAAKLVKPLEEVLGGRVHLKGGKFFVYSDDGFIEAHLLSEGLRKIASLVRLIVNGSLTKNGFLFWDEPEANLNPKLVTKIAEVLKSLADSGVQIFISTHDFLLSTELSLLAEYPQKTSKNPSIRFFTLNRADKSGIEIQSGSSLSELERNPILDSVVTRLKV